MEFPKKGRNAAKPQDEVGGFGLMESERMKRVVAKTTEMRKVTK